MLSDVIYNNAQHLILVFSCLTELQISPKISIDRCERVAWQTAK